MHTLFNICTAQVSALLLATAAAVCQDHARENLKIAIVIVYAISLMTAVQMQIHSAQDECSIMTQVYATKYYSSRKAL